MYICILYNYVKITEQDIKTNALEVRANQKLNHLSIPLIYIALLLHKLSIISFQKSLTQKQVG